MKEDKTTILEKNPNLYNSESAHIPPHRKSPQRFKDEIVNTSKKFYIESYGCQMNFADSEVVASIVTKQGYNPTKDINDADLILLNTCSIEKKLNKR